MCPNVSLPHPACSPSSPLIPSDKSHPAGPPCQRGNVHEVEGKKNPPISGSAEGLDQSHRSDLVSAIAPRCRCQYLRPGREGRGHTRMSPRSPKLFQSCLRLFPAPSRRDAQPEGRGGFFYSSFPPRAASSGASLLPKVIFHSHTSLRKNSEGRLPSTLRREFGFC